MQLQRLRSVKPRFFLFSIISFVTFQSLVHIHNYIHQLGTADNAIGEELLRLESLGEATANSVNR